MTFAGDDETREIFIEIVPSAGEMRVITTIEILSPANKAPGTGSRRLYETKQLEVLGSDTHLLEIDLLRGGEHTVAAPLERSIGSGYWDHRVSLSRAGPQRRYEVWTITLRQRLPCIPVPLADGKPDGALDLQPPFRPVDVALDLQPLFDRVYDAGSLAQRINYRSDPPVALSREDAEWADALLRERGLRR